MAVKRYFAIHAEGTLTVGWTLAVAMRRFSERFHGEPPATFEVYRVHPMTQLDLFGGWVFPKGHPPVKYTGGGTQRRQTKRERFAAWADVLEVKK